MANLYAQYFGGSLEGKNHTRNATSSLTRLLIAARWYLAVVPMDGYGTDVYLTLKDLGAKKAFSRPLV